MSSEESKKYSRIITGLAVSLIAVKLGLSTTGEIKIPQTGISVPVYALWFPFVFFCIPYIRELSKNNIFPVRIWKNELDSKLCTWSRGVVKAKWPDYIATQIRTEYLGLLSWSLTYHQAGKNPEPSYQAVSKPLNTIRVSLFALLSGVFELRVLELFTLPVVLSFVAITIWLTAFWN